MTLYDFLSLDQVTAAYILQYIENFKKICKTEPLRKREKRGKGGGTYRVLRVGQKELSSTARMPLDCSPL